MKLPQNEKAVRSVGADGWLRVPPDTNQNQLDHSIPLTSENGNTVLMQELKTIDGATLLSSPMEPIRFAIDGLLAQGAYLLVGPPKKGKSWMALQICLAVANGERLWNLDVTQGDALYLCLEDNLGRIQNRLFDITDDAPPTIHFATMCNGIGQGLAEQIILFTQRHPETKLVIIDTLQKVRKSPTDNAYASDYDDAGAVKRIADQLGVCIIMVHHTRKQKDSDPMNMISGTTGMPGAVDGYLILQNRKEDEYATLYCNGRDIESRELKLAFQKDSHRWQLVADSITEPEKFMANIFSVVCDYLKEHDRYCGSPSSLAAELQQHTEEKLEPGPLSKKLLQGTKELESLGIRYISRRSSGKRIVELSRDGAISDGSDGKGDMSP